MRNKYTPLIILIVISFGLFILISNNNADSGKLVYIPPNEAELILQSATVKSLSAVTTDIEEQKLINTVVDTYLKKYFTNPTQNPEANTANKPVGSTSDNDVYTYKFIVQANNENIVITVQHQQNLWIQVTASGEKNPLQTYQQYQSLLAGPSFEGN